MSDKKQKYQIKFLGRLPNVTRCYRKNYIEGFKRFIIFYISNTKYRHILFKTNTVFNKMGDEYAMFTVELASWGKGNKFFTIDTNGEIEGAPEYFLKSFDDHWTLFPRKIKCLTK